MKKMAKLYNQDGSGRDSYIFFNNGGFYPPEKRLFSKSPEINCMLLPHLRGIRLACPPEIRFSALQTLVLLLRWNRKGYLRCVSIFLI